MTTQDLINTLKQGKPMTDRLMREIVRELEEKTEQLRTMGTALRAKDADYAALRYAAEMYRAAYTTSNVSHSSRVVAGLGLDRLLSEEKSQ